MSDPAAATNDSVQSHQKVQASFVAQSALVEQLPDERVAIVTRMDFEVLKDGEVSEMRGLRDVCIGILGSGLFGLIGLFVTIDWATKSVKPYIWTALMVAIILASFALAIICHHQASLRRGCSAYATLMNRLTKHFSEN